VRKPLIALLLAGCASSQDAEQNDPRRNAMAVKLSEVCDNYNRVVQDAAQRIATAAPSIEQKRLVINWKIQTLAACRRALARPNPYVAFLDLWAMTLQRKRYLEEQGREAVGDLATIAIEANDTLIRYTETVAAGVFPESELAKTKAEVEAFAAAHPITGSLREWHGGGEGSAGESVFHAVTSLAPSLGIKKTATSIADVARSIDSIGEVVADVPLVARWNMTLLLYELNEDPAMTELRGDVHRVSESVARTVEVVDALPARVQAEVSKTLDEVDAKQEGLRQTLDVAKATAAEARAAVVEMRATVGEAQTAVASVEKLTENLTRAGEAWRPVADDLVTIVGPPSTEPSPPGPDQNIVNLASVAEHTRGAAAELSGALKELRAILEGDDLDRVNARAAGTVDHATGRLQGVIDLVFWRAVQLALVIAGIVLACRVVSMRLKRA
jgi:hypothetical protein